MSILECVQPMQFCFFRSIGVYEHVNFGFILGKTDDVHSVVSIMVWQSSLLEYCLVLYG